MLNHIRTNCAATIMTPSGLVEGDSYHLFILSPWASIHQHSSWHFLSGSSGAREICHC